MRLVIEENASVVQSSAQDVILTETVRPITLIRSEIGSPGVPGADGVDGDKTYVHEQIIPSDEWLIIHNLNKRPSVTVVDSAEAVIEGSMTYLSNDSLKIEFTAPFGGRAYIN